MKKIDYSWQLKLCILGNIPAFHFKMCSTKQKSSILSFSGKTKQKDGLYKCQGVA